jgi:hypothetical protein
MLTYTEGRVDYDLELSVSAVFGSDIDPTNNTKTTTVGVSP